MLEIEFAGGEVYELVANPKQGRHFFEGVERQTMTFRFAYSDEAFITLNTLFHNREKTEEIVLRYPVFNEEGEETTEERTLEGYSLYLSGGEDEHGQLVFWMAQTATAAEIQWKTAAEAAQAGQAEAELAASILLGEGGKEV